MRPVPILMYHSIDNRCDPRYRRWAVTPRTFDRQMSVLSEGGWQPVTVTELAAWVAAGIEPPDGTVAITFDDGLRDFLTGALPVLDRHGFTATLYVVAGLVGGTSRWLAPLGEGGRTMLDRDELRHVASAGIEIGGHTLSHPQLDVLPNAQAAAEIGGSRSLLEEFLGQPVLSFAYPHGYCSAATRRLVREAGYTSACRVRHALSSSTEDVYGLSRIIMTEEVGEGELADMLDGVGLPIAPAHDRLVSRGWRLARRISARMQAHRGLSPQP